EHHRRPLLEHLGDYRAALEARNDEPRYVALVVSRLTTLFEGCGFRLIPDLSLSRVEGWLATLRRDGPPAAELPAGAELFTRSEAAEALGMSVTAFRDAVKRYRLPATGKGPARRYPRATVEAVRDRRGRG